MANEEIAVKVVGDSSNLGQSMDRGADAVLSAMERIRASVDSVGNTLKDEFARSAEEAKKKLKDLGEEAEQTENPIKMMQESLRKAFEITGIAVAIEGIRKVVELIGEVGERSEAIENTAMMLGLTNTELQGLQAIAVKSGSSTEQLDKAMIRLNETLLKAKEGSGDAIALLEAFGVSEEMLKDPATELRDILPIVGARMAEAGVNANTTAAATQLLGIRSAQLVITLAQLKDGYKEVKAAADEVDALTDAQIKKNAQLGDALNVLGLQTKNMWASIVSSFQRGLELNGGGDGSMLSIASEPSPLQGQSNDDGENAVPGRPIEIPKVGQQSAIDVQLEQMKLAMDAARDDLKLREQIADQMVEYARSKYTEDSKQYFEALKVRQEAYRAYADDWKKTTDSLATAQAELGSKLLAEDMRDIAKQAEQHQQAITRQIQQEQRLAEAKRELDQQLIDQSARSYQKMFEPLTRELARSGTQMLTGTITLRRAVANVGQSMVQDFLRIGLRRVSTWLSSELAMSEATAAGVATRGAMEEGAASKSILLTAATAIKNIATKAVEVMASVYAAIAGIPYVGPFLAPAMAIAAGATVIGYASKVVSASGGYDIPRGVNPMAQLHTEEMVLPAPLANAVRDMASNGGSNGRGLADVHIHATDATSFKRLVKRERRAVFSAMDQMLRSRRPGYSLS